MGKSPMMRLGSHSCCKGQIWVRHRCVERQVQRRSTARIPVTVRHSSREDDECSGANLILLVLDFDTHCTFQDIENLIYLMSRVASLKKKDGNQ